MTCGVTPRHICRQPHFFSSLVALYPNLYPRETLSRSFLGQEGKVVVMATVSASYSQITCQFFRFQFYDKRYRWRFGKYLAILAGSASMTLSIVFKMRQPFMKRRSYTTVCKMLNLAILDSLSSVMSRRSQRTRLWDGQVANAYQDDSSEMKRGSKRNKVQRHGLAWTSRRYACGFFIFLSPLLLRNRCDHAHIFRLGFCVPCVSIGGCV